jgi:hypothetical protein
VARPKPAWKQESVTLATMGLSWVRQPALASIIDRS